MMTDIIIVWKKDKFRITFQDKVVGVMAVNVTYRNDLQVKEKHLTNKHS